MVKYTKLTPKIKENVRALAKKKFIALKIKEFLIATLSILGIIFLPYLVGLLYRYYIISEQIIITRTDYWITGFFVILVLAFIIAGFSIIGIMIWIGIRDFIKSNWNKAYKKAERELGINNERYWYEDMKEIYKR